MLLEWNFRNVAKTFESTRGECFKFFLIFNIKGKQQQKTSIIKFYSFLSQEINVFFPFYYLIPINFSISDANDRKQLEGIKKWKGKKKYFRFQNVNCNCK